MITDEELRVNHRFVTAFETLRKRHGYREMHELALQDIADSTGVAYETLRIARHLRNALAHGEKVNRKTLVQHDLILSEILQEVDRRNPTPATSPATSVRAFRVHAWQDPRLEEEMVANGFVSIGGAEMGNLTGVDDAEVIRSRLTAAMPDRPRRAISLYVGYWRRFLWDAATGDLVVLPIRRRKVAIGEFVGPYHYVDNVEPRARHRRAVSWSNTNVDREAFGPDLLVTLTGQHTVQDFNAANAVSGLRSIAEAGTAPLQ